MAMQGSEFRPNASPAEDAKWWETPEEHRFALEVLQLPIRRNILAFLAEECRGRQDIEDRFGLSASLADYHLAMLEKALVVERFGQCFRATSTGLLYLELVDGRRRSDK